jgi:hypothetical protein
MSEGKDYDSIRLICEESSAISSKVIDEFLIYYAAARNKTDKEFDKRLAAFKHIAKELEDSWIGYFKSQYIAHRISRKDGYIGKYLNHSEIKKLGAEELEFLHFQHDHSWRFSYSVINSNPAENFFEMTDIFRGNTFLLYSPGVTRMLDERPYKLWFNLIGYNGSCWQSFGTILGFQSFEPDDIFFFATELNPDIEDDDDLISNIEENPVPYMMLINGSQYPGVQSGGDEIIQVWGTYDSPPFDIMPLEKDFEIQEEDGIYEFSLKEPHPEPHFATAYYNEYENEISLHAMTYKGFERLIKKLSQDGINLPEEPDLMVSPGMISLAGRILRKKVALNPYEELFKKEPENNEQLDGLNKLLQLALPYVNSGQNPDVKKLANEAGVDEEAAREMLDAVIKRIHHLRK